MIKKVTFIQDDTDKLHFNILKDRVNQELLKLPESRKMYAKIRAIIFPVLYIMLYLLSTKFYTNQIVFYAIYGFMGMTTVLVFLNMVHEAVHDNIFKTRKYNRILLYFFDLIGSNSYIWK
jgi:linoleoyl-CoA desaturase